MRIKKASDIRSKKILLFKVVAFLLPFIIVALLEAGLRLGSYGTDLRLFHTDKKGKYYYMNPEIGKRYFTNEVNTTNGNVHAFKVKKTSGTFRIFILGESTSLGFPYMYNGTFPQMLKYRLQRQFPELDIEMINLSLTAINSYSILDISKEIVDYDPDAVLLYAGQNEFHGTLGIASAGNLGSNSLFIKAFIWAKRFRLMQLIHNSFTTESKNDPSTDRSKTLMERMAFGQRVPMDSPKYRKGVSQFERNINQITNIFAKNKIPLFISTLVMNEKSLHPFISQVASENSKEKFDQFFNRGRYELEQGDTVQAKASFLSAMAVDSTYAETYFQLGVIAYKSGEYRLAKKLFVQAKEYDQMRFRAPEVFNGIITKAVANKPGIFLVPTKNAFENASPHGIIGEELLLEHVHPNLAGYYLMAETFYQSLKASKVIEPKPENEIPEAIIRSQMPLTRLDTAYGYISNILLRENWPFNEPLPEQTAMEKTYEGKLAGAVAVNQFSWKEAMEKLFEYYLKNSDFPNALRTAEGQCLEYPFEGKYFERAAKLAQMTNEDQLAFFYLQKIWKNFTQNSGIARQLVIISLKADEPEQAIPYLKYLADNNSFNQPYVESMKMADEIIRLKKQLKTAPENVETLNAIAQLYIQSKNEFAGQKYISKILKIDPLNKKAGDMMIQLQKLKQ